MAMRTITQHESMRQAKTWETYTNKYEDLGLCRRCAAQAAYGHQHSFSVIHDPCAVCKPRVREFVNGTTNKAWRRAW